MNREQPDPSQPTLVSTTITDELVHGVWELEPTEHGLLPHRLPAWARAQTTDPQLAMVEAQPAGVRLVFRTTATVIELDTLRTRMGFSGMPSRPEGIYDLVIDGELVAQAVGNGGNRLWIDTTTGARELLPGPVGTVRFDAPPSASGPTASKPDISKPDISKPNISKEVQIWLPYAESTSLVGLRTDAPVEPVRESGHRVWLHHGSSISHGSNAASSATTWAALAAARGGVQLRNLGMGGSALLDPFTARTMRDTPADLISVKLGINLVNADLMRLRAFGPAVHGFLDTIRDGHPDLPLLVISPILCPIHEDTPGPGALDPEALAAGTVKYRATGDPAERSAGKLTLRVIREELARIVEQRAPADPNLHYLDGLRLYGEADFAELPLPDDLHPDAAAHRRMGERFAAYAFDQGGPFAAKASRR